MPGALGFGVGLPYGNALVGGGGVPPASGSALLREDATYILLEDGSHILLE